jgi:predicted Zn-dependent protease
VGSLPFFLRWFVRIDGVEGSKDQARVKLTRVAESGHYLKPFAQILLAIYYLREKKPAESQKILAELSRQYPENPLYRRELQRISQIAAGED